MTGLLSLPPCHGFEAGSLASKGFSTASSVTRTLPRCHLGENCFSPARRPFPTALNSVATQQTSSTQLVGENTFGDRLIGLTWVQSPIKRLNIVTLLHGAHLALALRGNVVMLLTYALCSSWYANEEIAHWHSMSHCEERKWFPYMLNPYPLSPFMLDLEQAGHLHVLHHKLAPNLKNDPDGLFYRYPLIPSYLLCILQPEISFFWYYLKNEGKWKFSVKDMFNMGLRLLVMRGLWKAFSVKALYVWLVMRAAHGVAYFMGTWMCHYNVRSRGENTPMARFNDFWIGLNMVSMVENHGDHHDPKNN